MSGEAGHVPALSLEVGLSEAVIDRITEVVAERLEAERTWLSTDALAERLGVPVGVVRSMRGAGMPGKRPAGTKRVFYSVAEVADWIGGH